MSAASKTVSAPPPRTRTLAELIESTLAANHQSAAEAARQIGVPGTQLSRWRRGVGGISMDHLHKLAGWLRVPLADLMPIAGYPPIDGSNTRVADPRLAAVAASWDSLEEGRKDIIHHIAVMLRNGSVILYSGRTAAA